MSLSEAARRACSSLLSVVLMAGCGDPGSFTLPTPKPFEVKPSYDISAQAYGDSVAVYAARPVGNGDGFRASIGAEEKPLSRVTQNGISHWEEFGSKPEAFTATVWTGAQQLASIPVPASFEVRTTPTAVAVYGRLQVRLHPAPGAGVTVRARHVPPATGAPACGQIPADEPLDVVPDVDGDALVAIPIAKSMGMGAPCEQTVAVRYETRGALSAAGEAVGLREESFVVTLLPDPTIDAGDGDAAGNDAGPDASDGSTDGAAE